MDTLNFEGPVQIAAWMLSRCARWAQPIRRVSLLTRMRRVSRTRTAMLAGHSVVAQMLVQQFGLGDRVSQDLGDASERRDRPRLMLGK